MGTQQLWGCAGRCHLWPGMERKKDKNEMILYFCSWRHSQFTQWGDWEELGGEGRAPCPRGGWDMDGTVLPVPWVLPGDGGQTHPPPTGAIKSRIPPAQQRLCPPTPRSVTQMSPAPGTLMWSAVPAGPGVAPGAHLGPYI